MQLQMPEWLRVCTLSKPPLSSVLLDRSFPRSPVHPWRRLPGSRYRFLAPALISFGIPGSWFQYESDPRILFRVLDSVSGSWLQFGPEPRFFVQDSWFQFSICFTLRVLGSRMTLNDDFSVTNQHQGCSPLSPISCPNGFHCMESTQGGHFICCTSGDITASYKGRLIFNLCPQ